MSSVEASGTQTATGAEDILLTSSNNREFVWIVDLDNMEAADTTVLRVYRKVLSTSSLKLLFARTFVGVNGGLTDPLLICAPFPSPHQARFTLQQTAGGLRTYEFSVESI